LRNRFGPLRSARTAAERGPDAPQAARRPEAGLERVKKVLTALHSGGSAADAHVSTRRTRGHRHITSAVVPLPTAQMPIRNWMTRGAGDPLAQRPDRTVAETSWSQPSVVSPLIVFSVFSTTISTRVPSVQLAAAASSVSRT